MSPDIGRYVNIDIKLVSLPNDELAAIARSAAELAKLVSRLTGERVCIAIEVGETE